MKGRIVTTILLSVMIFGANIAAAVKMNTLYNDTLILRMSDGREMKLSELSGKPSVVFFYNSKCGCSSHRRLMDKISAQYRGQGLQVIGVGLRENPDTFFAFAKKEGYGFASGFDATREIEKNCGVYRLPLTLFISSEGIIVKRAKGYLKEKEVNIEIEKLLS